MLIAVSAAWRRPEILRAWIEHTSTLGFDAIVVCVSRDDAYSDYCVWKAGLIRAFAPNAPLAGKFNAALQVAMDMGGTQFMILPSDDFASPAWVAAARDHEGDYLYPHTCGILDSATQNAYKIRKLGLGDGGQVGTLRFGAGRVISRAVIEKIGGTLWPANLNRGLDTASHNAIIAAGFKPTVITTEGIPITDVKTEENLWPYNAWIGSGDTITADEALHMCSPSVRAKLDTLKK